MTVELQRITLRTVVRYSFSEDYQLPLLAYDRTDTGVAILGLLAQARKTRKLCKQGAPLTAVCTRVSLAGIFKFAFQSPSAYCAMLAWAERRLIWSLLCAVISDVEARSFGASW